MAAPHDAEINENFEFFQTVVRQYLPKHAGEYALLRAQKVVSFFESPAKAALAGHAQFPDGVFSIQQVAQGPIDLGFYSHAVGQGEGL